MEGNRFAWLGILAGLVLVLPAPAHATFPGTNGKIAFSRDVGGNRDIFSINADGTGLVNLTNTATVGESQPNWSPDGQKIVYSRSGIWVMNADGSGQTQLRATGSDPAWSGDGQKIVFVDVPGGHRLYTMNSDGSGATSIFSPSGFERPGSPNWSPNGQKIAFSVADLDSRLAKINPDGTGYQDVAGWAELGESMEYYPNWSPDSGKIVFVGWGHGDGYPNGIVTDDGDQIKDTPCCGASTPAWSPDQQKVVFAIVNGSLYTINVDGTGEMPIPNTAGATDPDWQPAILPSLPNEGYARPKAASYVVASLVPAFNECSAPNAMHGAPLVGASCSPASASSQHLTVGTPDSISRVRSRWAS